MAAPFDNFQRLYGGFDAAVTDIDCGQMCAPNNPHGIPFCCDICHAAPAAYRPEWDYLQASTDLWHPYRGDECHSSAGGGLIDPDSIEPEAPAHMLLLACQGPARCRRPFRALSCRQFPFFPYITSWGQFIGLAYEWEFEAVCWVIHNLPRVTPRYREEFVRTYDEILQASPDDFKAYYFKSEEMRDVFAGRRRRIALLHRRGGEYRISPESERMRKAPNR